MSIKRKKLNTISTEIEWILGPTNLRNHETLQAISIIESSSMVTNDIKFSHRVHIRVRLDDFKRQLPGAKGAPSKYSSVLLN